MPRDAHAVDPADGRLAPFRQLADPAYRRRVEAGTSFRAGTAIVAGWDTLETAVATRQTFLAVLADPHHLERLVDMVGPSVDVVTASAELIGEVTQLESDSGPLAVIQRRRTLGAEQLVARSPQLATVSACPHELAMGHVFVAAAANDCAAVILDHGEPDPMARVTLATSGGAPLRIPHGVTDIARLRGNLLDGGWDGSPVATDELDGAELWLWARPF